jgi:D-aminopeptidase
MAPSERISVVVMFNHLADAHAAAADLLAAALDEDRPPRPSIDAPPPAWLGTYLEPQTGLSARIEAGENGRARLRYGYPPELLDLQADGSARSDSAQLRLGDGGLWMDRPRENQKSLLRPCAGAPTIDHSGRYRCEELNAELTIVDAGGALYGAFSGFLGQGRMELLDPVGPDVWVLPCLRALDYTPPGDWTLAFARDEAGKVGSVDVGCWLARRLSYARID